MNIENAAAIAASIASAWLGNPSTRADADEVAAFYSKVFSAVSGGSEPVEPALPQHTPAVTVRQSLASKDHILSMIDGKPYKTLRRHLATHGLTPAEYRERYGLKPEYPMVAESYSAKRRELALSAGLGHGTHTRAGAKA